MKVYLQLAEGFEEIEAVTVTDVLRRADIDVETVSVTGKREVTGAHDITVMADRIFEETDYSRADMIVLPGGMPGTLNLGKHDGLMQKLMEYAQEGKWIAAICAAPSIIGRLGILKGLDATCFPGFEDELKGANVNTQHVVHTDKIITSRGPGTAIKFSLKIVEVIKGIEVADKIKKAMIADWS
jgi:4-methyl-5(b-hydroxyethyl)-thiazole monophosphate biosynthesis